MDFLQTIGKRIRARRHALGMSQEALAERAGLHYTYIGQIESRSGFNAPQHYFQVLARPESFSIRGNAYLNHCQCVG